MFRSVVIALLFLAVVHGHRTGEGRGQTRPNDNLPVNAGNQPQNPLSNRPLDLPDNIPVAWKLQLRNVFDRMQQQIDSGSQIDLTAWNNEALNILDTWAQKLENKYDHPSHGDFPEQFPGFLRQKVNQIFTDMQEDLDSGQPLDVDSAREELSDQVDVWWNRFSSMMEQGSSFLAVSNSQASSNQQSGSNRQPGPNRQPSSNRQAGQNQALLPQNLPEDLPMQARKPFRDFFDRMQVEIDSGRNLILYDWHNKMQNIVQEFYSRMTRRLKKKGIQGGSAFPDEVPQRVVQQFINLFIQMKNELTAGKTLDLSAYYDKVINIHLEEMWDRFTALMETSRIKQGPSGGLHVDDVPYRLMAGFSEVFNMMQNELDQGNTLDISAWHRRADNASSEWWAGLVKLVERRIASWHGLPDEIPKRMAEEVCTLFERMEQEYDEGNNTIVLSDWQDELEIMVENWWDRVNARLRSGGSVSFTPDIPPQMMSDLMETFDLMQIELDQGRPLNISVWDSRAHQATGKWWAIIVQRLERKVGNQNELPKQITKPMSDQVCAIFDRMQVEIDNGNDIDLSLWRSEFETLVEGWWDRATRRVFTRPRGPHAQAYWQTNGGPKQPSARGQSSNRKNQPFRPRGSDEERDQPEYQVICEGKGYEARQYYRSMWVTTKVNAMTYNEAAAMCAPSLLKYLRGNNMNNTQMPNTAPLHTKVQMTAHTDSCMLHEFTCSVFIPTVYHDDPLIPRDPKLVIETVEPSVMYAYAFQGFVANIDMWAYLNRFIAALDTSEEDYENDAFYVDVYDNPWKLLNRHNEILVPMNISLIIPTCSLMVPIPEPQPEPEPELEPSDAVHPVPHPEPSGAWFSPEPAAEPQPEPSAEPQPEPSAELEAGHVWFSPEPSPEPELVPFPEPSSEPELVPFPEPSAEPELVPFPEPSAEPELQPFPEPSAEPEPANVWFSPELSAEPEPEPSPESELELVDVIPAPEPVGGQEIINPGIELGGNNQQTEIEIPGSDMPCDQGITCPRYETAARFVDYQQRAYSASRWVCIDIVNACDVIEAKSTSYETLRSYFGSAGNWEGIQMTPTVPLVIGLDVSDLNRQACDKAFTSCMYIPEEHRGNPPTPQEARLYISDVARTSRFVYPFAVLPTPENVSQYTSLFLRTLEFDRLSYDGSTAAVAFYTPTDTAQTQHNEIWVSE